MLKTARIAVSVCRKKWRVRKGRLFRKKKRKTQGATGISGKNRAPPGFPPRSAEWVRQGHRTQVTPGAPSHSLPHPAGPATSVCSVCQGRANTKVRAEPPTQGAHTSAPGAGPRGGQRPERTTMCASAPGPLPTRGTLARSAQRQAPTRVTRQTDHTTCPHTPTPPRPDVHHEHDMTGARCPNRA